MQVKISSKHMDITPPIENYALRKVEKLRRFFDRIQQIDVVIDKSKKGYIVEIITDVEHHEPFIATCNDNDLYACIDLGVDRSIRQITDHKSRLRNRKHLMAGVPEPDESHPIGVTKNGTSGRPTKSSSRRGSARSGRKK